MISINHIDDKQLNQVLPMLKEWQKQFCLYCKGSAKETAAGVLVLLLAKFYLRNLWREPKNTATIFDVLNLILNRSGWQDLQSIMPKWVEVNNIDQIWEDVKKVPDDIFNDGRNLDFMINILEGALYPQKMSCGGWPMCVAYSMVDMLNIKASDLVCDPACGEGTLLCAIIDRFGTTVDITGYESDPIDAFIAKFRLMVRGQNPERIHFSDVLTDNTVDFHQYDAVLTCPPLGVRRKVYELKLYQLTGDYAFEDEKRLETSVTLKSLSLVKEGGRIVLMLPAWILSSRRGQNLRNVLLRNLNIDALVEMSDQRLAGGRGVSFVLSAIKRSSGGQRCGNISLGVINGKGRDLDALGLEWREFMQKKKFSDKEDDVFVRVEHLPGETWSARAYFADRYLHAISRINSFTRIGDVLGLLERPRSIESVHESCYIDHGVDGVVKSDEPVALRNRVFRSPINVAERDDLLISLNARRMVADVVPQECAEQVPREPFQLYQGLGGSSAMVFKEYVAILFKSNTYRKYLRRRFVSEIWHEDLLNYIVPQMDGGLDRLLSLYEEYKVFRRSTQDSIKTLSHEISRIYRQILGIRQRSFPYFDYWSDTYPTFPMSSFVHAGSQDSVSFNRIMGNLIISNPDVDERYIVGFLVCDFLPRRVRNVILNSFPHYHIGIYLSKIGIPFPPLEIQRMVVDRTREYIQELIAVIDRKEKSYLLDRLQREIDVQLFLT